MLNLITYYVVLYFLRFFQFLLEQVDYVYGHTRAKIFDCAGYFCNVDQWLSNLTRSELAWRILDQKL